MPNFNLISNIKVAVFALLGALVFSPMTFASPTSWSVYLEPNYGSIVYYPDNLFQIDGETVFDGNGRRFVTEDKSAELISSTVFDQTRRGALANFVDLIKERDMRGVVLEAKVSQYSYELKIKDGDQWVYDVGIFSCREQVYNRVQIIYGKKMKEQIEAILPKLRKRFSAGVGAHTPTNSCN